MAPPPQLKDRVALPDGSGKAPFTSPPSVTGWLTAILYGGRRSRDRLHCSQELAGELLAPYSARRRPGVPPGLLLSSYLANSSITLTSLAGMGFTLLVPRRARTASLRSQLLGSHHRHLFGACSDLPTVALYVPFNPCHACQLSDLAFDEARHISNNNARRNGLLIPGGGRRPAALHCHRTGPLRSLATSLPGLQQCRPVRS